MTITAIKPSFAKGELSPSVWGRTDLAAWAIGASVERNCFVSYRGPASSRAGLAYVSKSLTPAAAGSLPPRIIRFQFNIYQSYILEFGVDGLGRRYMRVIANGGLVTDTTVAVTAVASSDPVAISATNTFAAGDYPFGSGFPPGTPLNREVVVGSPTGAGFVLDDLFGNPIDGTGFTGYTGGGTFSRVYATYTSPYALADLPYLKVVQSADVMS